MTNSAGGGPGVTGSTQVARKPSIIGARRGGSLLSYVALFKQRSPYSVFTQRATDSQKHDLITCESTQATLHAEPAIDTWTIGPCCSTNMFCVNVKQSWKRPAKLWLHNRNGTERDIFLENALKFAFIRCSKFEV